MGAFLPGLAWNSGGWPACVAMVVAVLAADGGDRRARLWPRRGLDFAADWMPSAPLDSRASGNPGLLSFTDAKDSGSPPARGRTEERIVASEQGGTNDRTDQSATRIPALDRHADGVQPGRDGGARAARPRLHRQASALPVSRPAADRRLRQDRDLQGQGQGAARRGRLHAEAARLSRLRRGRAAARRSW